MLGQGSFGIVQRAAHKESGIEVAIKQYDRFKLYLDTLRVQALKREVQILKSLSNDGVMRFIDLIDSGNKINIILEYINGNNLY